jgi:predicted Zn-dependent protease
MREAVGIDSSYFVGLLWSWHYATQIGDTTTARTFLRKLESIDPSNAVVVSFRTMSALADTLRKISSPAERSRLRLLIARQYEKMELPEDCIDEAERAAGEDPSNPEAWKFLAGLFEGKGKMRAAQKASQHLQQTEPASKDAKSLVSEAQRSQ